MLYIIILLLAIDATALVWYLIAYTPKKKKSKPNYCAKADDKLSIYL